MASRLGDQTARLQGRVTLNPIYHVDPVGTLLFPALMIFGPLIGGGMLGGYLIGWAKPTPVITRNFKNIVRDDNLVTLAGPVSNLILALCGFLGLVAIILFTRSAASQQETLERQLSMRWQRSANWRILSTLRFSSSTCCPFRRSMAAASCATFCPTTCAQLRSTSIGILGYVLMILVGGPVVRFLLTPTMELVYSALSLLQST